MTQVAQVRPGAQEPPVHKPAKRNAPWPVQFYGSAVGKKWVMALTGAGLMGFVFVHMIGNLKIYLGPTEINEYGEALRTLLYPILPHHVVLWIFRVGLIVMFGAHIHAATALTVMNRSSRPDRYQSPRDYVAANFASRSMRYTGVIVAAYLVFHLFDLSWTGTGYQFLRGDVHHNFIESMSRPPIAIAYIVANLAVAVHLYHGAWSMFQSLGLNNPRYNGARRMFAGGFATMIGVINVMFPIMVLAKVIK